MKKTLFLLIGFLIVFSNFLLAQWTQQTSNVSPPTQIDGMDFIHADTGFAVGGGAGGGGFIRKTNDGGMNWTIIPYPLSSSVNLFEVRMINANVIYAVGFDFFTYNTTGGRIIKSSDGGNTWTIQNTVTYPGFFAIEFLNKDTAFVVGYNGIILKTVNGGNVWQQVVSGVTDNLRDVSFPTPDTGYIIAEYNKILKTVDGGNNWTVLTNNTTNIRVGMYFVSADTGYTSGGGCIDRTTDGGASWSAYPTTNFTQSIHFPHRDTGYAVGGFGEVMQTTDGGNSWSSLPISGFGAHGLYEVFFLNSMVGYVGGYDGKLFKTTEGGGFGGAVGQEFFKETASIQVRPNPSNGAFTVHAPEQSAVRILIFDQTGRCIIDQTTEGGILSVDISAQPRGIYLLRLIDREGSALSHEVIIH